MGPNHVLDKGFYIDPASGTVNFGVAAAISGVSQGNVGVLGDTAKVMTTAGPVAGAVNSPFIGVFQETLDAAKTATGKATASVRVMGISRAQSDGSAVIAVGDRVAVSALSTLGQFKTIAAVAGTPFVGIALSPAAATVGAVFDMLIIPGGSGQI